MQKSPQNTSAAARPPGKHRSSRAQLAARVAARFGILRGIALARANRGLVALAYHRIGNPLGCPVDGGVFNATPEALAEHVRMLQRWSRVVSLEEVEHYYASGSRFPSALAMLTFDDAYRDNYTTAFPILRPAGVPATFFVPTGFIERGHAPHWDRIAYAVKHTRVDGCALEHPRGARISNLRSDPETAISILLRLYKEVRELDPERFLEEVETSLGARAAGSMGELFASWAELREMVEGGMAIGSHTHTHRLLGRLPYDEQVRELARSRELLLQHVGVRVSSLAYPVGHLADGHFTADTHRALTSLGYRLAFSHYNGWNRTPSDPYDVRRIRIDRHTTPDVLQARLRFPAVFC
jgi:peptidoglycan/xylan/chitin deacetylase (PgdA/CDA1 family)